MNLIPDGWVAGIKEGLYDVEALAAYLLYRLNVLNPVCECTSSFRSICTVSDRNVDFQRLHTLTSFRLRLHPLPISRFF